MLVGQDADQLGGCNGRVRIIQLNGGALGQGMKVAVGAQEPRDDVPQGSGGEKILLL